MDPRARIAAIRRSSDALSHMGKAEADLLLRAASATRETPPDYDKVSTPRARPLLLTQLDAETDETLLRLVNLLREDDDVVEAALASPDRAAPLPLSVEEIPEQDDGSSSIFLVHGHARAQLHETVRVLERTTGRDVIVLHERPNAGRTIIEKFEDHAAGVAYAVVLLTGDDTGGVASGVSQLPRGRQNVVFELGFFFGKLGRDRVAVLLEPGVEKPSDIDGLVYIQLDDSGAWKQALARELESAGIDIEYSRMP